jgi:hypothetical protein
MQSMRCTRARRSSLSSSSDRLERRLREFEGRDALAEGAGSALCRCRHMEKLHVHTMAIRSICPFSRPANQLREKRIALASHFLYV